MSHPTEDDRWACFGRFAVFAALLALLFGIAKICTLGTDDPGIHVELGIAVGWVARMIWRGLMRDDYYFGTKP